MAHDTSALVGEFQSSGLTQKDFCARKGIAVSALQYHLGKSRKQPTEYRAKHSAATSGQFIPLHIQQAGGCATTVVIVRGHFGGRSLEEFVRAVAE